MTLELKVYSALCSTEVFRINGISADSSEFGEQYDAGREYAEDYCCGNMVFERKDSTPELLKTYGITEDEYDEICSELERELSFGSCGWCS